MGKRYLIGVDLGTTTCKGRIIDDEAKTVCTYSTEYYYDSPKPGWCEVDVENVWWRSFATVVRQLLKSSGMAGKEIAGVCTSAIYPVLVPLDESYKPLRKAILYGIDSRASQEVEELNRRIGSANILDRFGNYLTNQSTYPKMLWLSRNEPDVFEKTRYFAGATSYLVLKLTGNLIIDHGSASGTMPYDFHKQCWDPVACEFIGIRQEQLPELRFANELAGYVTEAAAAETGLAAGTPVAVGTGDHPAETVSLGGYQPGSAVFSYGTTLGLDVVCDKPFINKNLMSARSCIGHLYTVGGATSNGANITRWFRDNFGQPELETERKEGKNAYAELARLAESVEPGAEGITVVPYFCGERIPVIDPMATGIIFGLKTTHSRAHVYRAMLEGVSLCLRHVVECLNSSGVEIQKIVSVGGGTKNEVWTQIVSDITCLTQLIPDPQEVGSDVGDAYLAGMAAGVFDESLFERLSERKCRVVRPRIERIDMYRKKYLVFRQLYELTKHLNY